MAPILKVLLRRLALGALTLLIVSAMIFLAVELLPGDIATETLGQSATPESLAALREKLGLNQPAALRYLAWVAGALQGDFGMSLANQRPIGELIAVRAFNTFFLAGHAAVIAVPLSLFLGLLAALYRDSILDKLISTTTLATISSMVLPASRTRRLPASTRFTDDWISSLISWAALALPARYA